MASFIWINRTATVLYKILGVTLLLNIGCAENKDTSTNDGPINSDTASTTETDTATVDSAEPEMEIGECGDGVVNSPTEECDDGEANANSADACRTDCLLPKCGDGIVDEDESCDDNNLWNIDGCDEDCVLEIGELSWNQMIRILRQTFWETVEYCEECCGNKTQIVTPSYLKKTTILNSRSIQNKKNALT